MLIVDSKKRIEWDALFTHPIVRYLDKILMKDIEDKQKAMVSMEDQLYR